MPPVVSSSQQRSVSRRCCYPLVLVIVLNVKALMPDLQLLQEVPIPD
jgi:hypothetical protein